MGKVEDCTLEARSAGGPLVMLYLCSFKILNNKYKFCEKLKSVCVSLRINAYFAAFLWFVVKKTSSGRLFIAPKVVV